MTGRTLGKKEMTDIVWGATFLGSGGGGSMRDGLRLIKDIENDVILLDPKELPESAYVATVGGMGAPKALAEKKFGPEAITAFKAMQNIMSIGGVKIEYLYSGEMGGLNTIVPLYVAAKINMPVVDADGNGRAVPELGTSLNPIHGVPTSPITVANKAGDIIVAYLDNPQDSSAAETIARTAAISFGMVAGFSTWVMNLVTLKNCMVVGGISLAEKIGKVLREASAGGKDATADILAITGGKELFRGKIAKIQLKTVEGFDFGKTTITGIAEYKGETLVVDFKNENIIAWQDNKPVIMAPDLITMMTTKGEPLNNADIEEGMELVVIGIKAPEPWMRKPAGVNCWKHILSKLGYDGPFVTPF